jgi:hypothetical protein
VPGKSTNFRPRLRHAIIGDHRRPAEVVTVRFFGGFSVPEVAATLEVSHTKRNGESIWADWVFLAMAHHRLGHHGEARRWIDRFRDGSPNLVPSEFRQELEARLLRTEAEAMVLWDPIFPPDPFAF